MDLTASNVHDARRLSSLLSKTPGSIGQVSADRAYDTGSCYEAGYCQVKQFGGILAARRHR